MRYVAAYLLAALGGNENPSADNLKAILESVGVGYDAERAASVVGQLKGKALAEVGENSFSRISMIIIRLIIETSILLSFIALFTVNFCL